ncbi:MAG TPA: twin-arginine translocase TatA/TatE family subunit [Gemmatimonadales bacterium]|nr:twin-arginine translocase TatA/TatE family subunit [Gemmatimonadales bacterium]
MGLGNLSGSEILILMLIVLLVFGANRLPEAGRAVGKGLREFKRALSDAENSIHRTDEETPPARDATPKRLVE